MRDGWRYAPARFKGSKNVYYKKTALTMIAVALVAIAVRGFYVVGSANAYGNKVFKIGFCSSDGSKCAKLMRIPGVRED